MSDSIEAWTVKIFLSYYVSDSIESSAIFVFVVDREVSRANKCVKLKHFVVLATMSVPRPFCSKD